MIYSYIAAILVMAVAAYIDQKERIVPNWLSLCALSIGVILSTLCPAIHDAHNWWQGMLSAYGNCALVAVCMCWYGIMVEKIFSFQPMEGLGGGDIKILAALSAILNFKIIFMLLLVWPVFSLMQFAYLRFKNYEVFSTPACPSFLITLLFVMPFSRWL